MEAIIINRAPGDPEADPPIPTRSGQRVEVAQAVVFDDAVLGNTVPYEPGDPSTEQLLRVIIETPIMLEVSAFSGLSGAQAQALWDTALAAQKDAWLADPDIGALLMAAEGARRSPYVVLP